MVKKVFRIFKILLSLIFTAYSLIIVYSLIIAPKEKRFQFAGHMQGVGFSQSVFAILNWQHPDYSDAFFERSVPFNKRGEYFTGFYYLNKAVDLEPVKHLGYRGYMKLRFLRDFKGALNDLNRLDSLTPNVVDAPWGENIDFLRGECYYGLGNYSKALEYFNSSVENQGAEWADVQTMVYQGLCNYKLADFEKAKSSFENALSHYDKTPEAHFGLGKTLLQMGDTVNAINSMKTAKDNIAFKRDDHYKEFLNEIYVEEIQKLLDSISE